MSKRKVRLVIGLIVIVAVVGVSAFLYYPYSMNLKETGNWSVALDVIGKTDTSITFSWEQHDIVIFVSYNLRMSTIESDQFSQGNWTEVFKTTNVNVTSTTIGNLSPDTPYWFYMAVTNLNSGRYSDSHHSTTIQTITYPSNYKFVFPALVLIVIMVVVLELISEIKRRLPKPRH